MTPTEQTRLAEIRKTAEIADPYLFGKDKVRFLLSLLSQETKRADEAEARTWEEAAYMMMEATEGNPFMYDAFVRPLENKAAAVRRGREGKP